MHDDFDSFPDGDGKHLQIQDPHEILETLEFVQFVFGFLHQPCFLL